jgi:hypothetical protein
LPPPNTEAAARHTRLSDARGPLEGAEEVRLPERGQPVKSIQGNRLHAREAVIVLEARGSGLYDDALRLDGRARQ